MVAKLKKQETNSWYDVTTIFCVAKVGNATSSKQENII